MVCERDVVCPFIVVEVEEKEEDWNVDEDWVVGIVDVWFGWYVLMDVYVVVGFWIGGFEKESGSFDGLKGYG